MKRFNDFSKKLQKGLNKTSFWIAEKFLIVGFIFFFFGINDLIKHPEIDIARTSEFFPIMILMSCAGIIINFFGIRSKEKYFLSTKKFNINRYAIVDKIILIGIIVPSILGYVISLETLFIYFSLSGLSFLIESMFVDSTPIIPRDK